MDPSKMKICYVITENKGKSFFNRIGIAFVNRDGSLNVKLYAFPVGGEMHIRDYEPQNYSNRNEPRNEPPADSRGDIGDEGEWPF